MTTAQQVLDVARSQVGTVEARDGSTAYHRAYGLAFDQPWCAVFLWWCFQQVGAGDLIHPRTAFTPTLYTWLARRGQASPNPRVGSLAFFDWPTDEVKRIQHVGLVEVIRPDEIVTIEGNTTPPRGGGNQANGGGVWRRRRPRDASIIGYGHPAYTDPEDDLNPYQAEQLARIDATLRSGEAGVRPAGEVALLLHQIREDQRVLWLRVDDLARQLEANDAQQP
jgi:hypothetical protein